MAVIKLPTYEEYKQRLATNTPLIKPEEMAAPVSQEEPIDYDSLPKVDYIPEGGIEIPRPTAPEIMSYGWNVKGITDMQSLGKIGRIKGWFNGGMFDGSEYKQLDEFYGEDFNNLTESEKRDRINEVDRLNTIRNNFSVLAYGEDNSLLAGASGFAGTLATPTTLVPGLSWAKYGAAGLGVTSALFGAEYNLLEQYANKGNVDMGELGKVTALSGVGGLGLGLAGKGAMRLLNGAKPIAASQKASVQSEADMVQDAMDDAVIDGIPPEKLNEYVKEKTGFSDDEVVKASANSERKPGPRSKEEILETRELERTSIDADTINRSPTVNRYVTPIIEGFARIDEKFKLNGLLKNRVNRYFYRSYTNAMDKITPSHSLLKGYKKMPKQQQESFNNLLLNPTEENIASAGKLLDDYSPVSGKELQDLMTKVRTMTDELKAAGIDVPANPNYVPRIVKDSKGLQRFLNKNPEVDSVVQKALKQRAQALKLKDTTKLSNEDRNFIISNMLQGRHVGTNKAGKLYSRTKKTRPKRETFLEPRKIKLVNKEMQKYYENPLNSTMRYFMDAHKLIEKRNFFNYKNTKNATMQGTGLDLEKSATNFFKDLEDANLDDNTVTRLEEMFKAIFVDADRSLGGVQKAYKDLVNASLLANPLSALTQLGDVTLGAWKLGVKNVAKGLVGRDVDIIKDLNIEQAMLEHFSSGTSMTKLVDDMLEFTQFKRMDRLGKTAIINGAWKNVQNKVKTDKGIAQLKKEYGTAYGPEFNKFISDIKNGEITSLTKEYLFNQLAEFQPITPAQMPEAYLKANNGRLLYTLQSFTIKQVNLIRKNIVEEAQKGNYKQAAKNLLGFSLLIPPSNMAIDYGKETLLGRDPDFSDDLVRRYANNALKVFGSSEYAVDRLIKTGKLGDFIQDTFLPPMEMFDGLIKTGQAAIVNQEFDPAVTAQLPIVGRLAHYWVFGGLEDWNEKQKQKDRREYNKKYGIDKKKYGMEG